MAPKNEISAIEQNTQNHQNSEPLGNYSDEALIFALKQRKNNSNSANWRSGNGHSDSKPGNSQSQTQNKNGQGNKQNQQGNSSSQNSDKKNGYKGNKASVHCWYCKKTGHMQLTCRKRISDNAPMSYKGKPVVNNNNKQVMSVDDFTNYQEKQEWTEKLNAQGTKDPNSTDQDFQ